MRSLGVTAFRMTELFGFTCAIGTSGEEQEGGINVRFARERKRERRDATTRRKRRTHKSSMNEQNSFLALDSDDRVQYTACDIEESFGVSGKSCLLWFVDERDDLVEEFVWEGGGRLEVQRYER